MEEMFIGKTYFYTIQALEIFLELTGCAVSRSEVHPAEKSSLRKIFLGERTINLINPQNTKSKNIWGATDIDAPRRTLSKYTQENPIRFLSKVKDLREKVQ